MCQGLPVDLGLAGRTVLCTGAAGGIGRQTARLLAEEGAFVACVDRDGDALADLL
ncbi:MAG: SDR family NAD(P)-dependent oxidoreductase, partial [Actinomycetota bacterium]